ncbi:MAG: hypothetical protein MJD61_22135 [Proteobacteria bacterium]|nr:hypothetical protein [Pseudomonadota bacterium]
MSVSKNVRTRTCNPVLVAALVAGIAVCAGGCNNQQPIGAAGFGGFGFGAAGFGFGGFGFGGFGFSGFGWGPSGFGGFGPAGLGFGSGTCPVTATCVNNPQVSPIPYCAYTQSSPPPFNMLPPPCGTTQCDALGGECVSFPGLIPATPRCFKACSP